MEKSDRLTKKHPLYKIDLKLKFDNNQQLRQLTEIIREEASNATGWHRLGKLLLKIGQFDKAEELYTLLLEQAFNDTDRAYIYSELGKVKWNQGKYNEAV